MEQTTTIRSKLDEYIRREGVTLQKLAENSNINPGTLSAIMRANRPIAMRQLDNLTAGMGLQKGTFYDLYVNECLIDYIPNWRRLRPFLYQCAELNKLKCIERVTTHIVDNLAYVPLLFETAEDFFAMKKYSAARILYACVAETERYQHSERLALCQYRLFTMSIDLDQQANLRAAVSFEGYVDRLCEEDQLDALRQLANVYYALRLWKKVHDLGVEMGKKAQILYSFKTRKRNKEQSKKTDRPIFVYILYSYLLQGAVFAENQEYEHALYYTNLYADMSWVTINDEVDELHKKRFEKWAQANTYMYKMMSGDISTLPNYIKFMRKNENEVLIAIMRIIEAANRYNYDVDYVLDEFDNAIQKLMQTSTYNILLNEFRYIKLYSELAIYNFRKNRQEAGIQATLVCLKSAVKNNSIETVIICVGLFEKNRHYASPKDIDHYQYLIEEVQKVNEETHYGYS